MPTRPNAEQLPVELGATIFPGNKEDLAECRHHRLAASAIKYSHHDSVQKRRLGRHRKHD